MRADTPTSFRRLSLLLAAAFALAVAPDAAAQSELIVEPGPPGVLNDAIENDTARPADRVYVLRQGAYYGVTREINNQGYTLRIKAEGTEGTRPVIYPAPDNTGTPPGSRYFNLGGDVYFSGLYFLAVDPSQGEVATTFALNAPGMRFVVDNSVFQGGRSRLIEVNVDDTKLLISNSQFRNLVRNDGTSNGRPIDYRTVRADSLVVTNTSFLNISGYLVRYDGSEMNTVVFDHVTVYGTNREMWTNAFGTQAINYRFTNNLVVNPYGDGQPPVEDGVLPQGVVALDSLDAGIDNGFTEADRTIRIENNGYMITADLQAYYDARTAASDPIQPRALLDNGLLEYVAANAGVVVGNNETYDIGFTTPPDLTDYIAWLGAFRDGAADPGTWAFGEEDGNYFPADQPPPEDLSYASTEAAYTAAQGGFPLGSLTYFPALLEQWEAGGGLSVANETAPGADGFALDGTFPNPSAGRLAVQLSLDAAAVVTLDVYDTLGRRVLTVPAQTVAAGDRQSVAVDASSLPSGVYLVRATAEAGGVVRARTSRFTVAR